MMLEELQRRNYSQTTVNRLPAVVEDFADYFHQSARSARTGPHRAYQAYLFQERKLGARTVRPAHGALRFFF